MKDIHIKFVEQSEQSYDTVGDYGETENEVWFKITRFPDKPAYSIAILLHEIHEFYRNKQLGVTTEEVDVFDKEGPGKDLDDPGLSPLAPYHRQHMESDVIERLHIILSGEDWVEYENAIDALFKEVSSV